MNKAKKNYQKQCKIKTITFYKKDAEILKLANHMNFQKFVKQALQDQLDAYDTLGIDPYFTEVIKPWQELGGDNGNIQNN